MPQDGQFFVSDYELMNITFVDGREEKSHHHREFEIIYCMKGSLQCTIENENVVLSAGEFVLIPSRKEHSFCANEYIIILSIHFNNDMCQNYIDLSKLSGSSHLLMPYELEQIKKKINRIANLYFTNDKELHLLRQSVYFELLYYISLYFKDKEKAVLSETDIRKEKINQFIEKNFTSSLKLGDLAKELHLSEVYLSKSFKKMFGVNFHKYLTDFRMEEAYKDLINHENHSVLRVAMDNGFSNVSVFNTEFKKRYHMTPLECRTENREKAAQKKLEENKIIEKMNFISSEAFQGKEEDAHEKIMDISCITTKGSLYEKSWEKVINVGRARELIRSEVQKHMAYIGAELGITYLRIWDIYDPELQLIMEDDRKQIYYDFIKLDRVIDFMYENHFMPYIDMGIKPFLLLREEGNVIAESKPNPLIEKEGELEKFVQSFMIHYSKRYGIEEMKKWYLEIWFDYRNADDQMINRYKEVYRNIHKIVKRIVPDIKLGGVGDNPIILETKFKDILSLFDFVSAYSYSDKYEQNKNEDKKGSAGKRDDLKSVIKQIESITEKMNNTPEVHISEWNYTVSNRNALNDGPYKSSYIVKKAIEMIGSADIVAYWMASDLTSEKNTNKPLYGGSGLITRHGINKPSFYAFQFLHNLGKILIYKNESMIITKDQQGSYQILCCNYKNLNMKARNMHEYQLQTLKAQDVLEDMDVLTVKCELKNIENGIYQIRSRFINEHYGSAFDLLPSLQNDDSELGYQDILFLKEHCIPQNDVFKQIVTENVLNIQIDLQPSEIRYMQIGLL